MSGVCEVVTVVRKDHPAGKVDINKSDLTDKDVIYQVPVKAPARKTRARKSK